MTLQWLSAQGNRLVNEVGQAVVLRGVNIDRFNPLISATFPDAGSGNYEAIAAPVLFNLWRANSLTIPIASGPVNRGDLDRPEYIPGTGPVPTTPGFFYLQVLDRIVAAATAAGMYVNLAYRFPEPDDAQPDFPDLAAQQAMAALAQRYRANPGVLYSLQVEPGNDASKIPWSEMFRNPNVAPVAFLKPLFEAMIDAIRAVHPQSLIFVPGNQFGRFVWYQLSDPIIRPNLVFKSHTYDTVADIQGPFYKLAELAAQYPVFIGEFGPRLDEVTLAELAPLLDWFESIGAVGWHAWQFLSVGPPTLLASYNLGAGTFTPSQYGVVVQSYLQALAGGPLPLPDPLGPPEGTLTLTGKLVLGGAVVATIAGVLRIIMTQGGPRR